MKIKRLLTSVGLSGLLYKDLAAIKAGAKPNGSLLYDGEPVTPGFRKIIQPGETVSVMLELEDGTIGFGDCAEVILVGLAGRDPMFDPRELLPIIEGEVAELLVGRDTGEFRTLCEQIDSMKVGGKRLHSAVRYGVSQALLDAAAVAERLTMTEVICREYDLTPAQRRCPVLAGALRLDWAQHDRLILKRADVMPHTPFLSVRDHVGEKGELLIEYCEKLAARIAEVGDADYAPRIHIDLYGTLGEAFDNDPVRIAALIGRLAEIFAPLELLVESPVIGASREEQAGIYAAIRAELDAGGTTAQLVMDEWANTLGDIRYFHEAGALQNVQIKTPDVGCITGTIEALVYCREHGIGACLGGSANETDKSARVTAHIALACSADMVSTKPGQGADEGWMILANEMERTLALMAARASA